MRIENDFPVRLSPDAAFARLLDVPGIAACVPGASYLGPRDDGAHGGAVTVALGPVTMQFKGSLKIAACDAASRTATVEARGQDTKGRGQASARSAITVEPEGGGSRVRVATDVTLGGMAAQYGRATGMIEALSREIVAQFATNLDRMLVAEGPVATASPAAPVGGFGLLLRAMLRWMRERLGGARRVPH